MNPAAASRPHHVQTEEPITVKSLSAHTRRALFTQVRTRIAALQDAGEAGAPPGSIHEGPQARERAAPENEPAAKPRTPRRRIYAFLIYAGVLLAGGTGGGVLAYTQFQKQIGQLLEENLRLEAARVKTIKPGAQTLKTFEAEQVKRVEAEEKQLAALHASEATRSIQQPAPASRSDSKKPRPPRSGDCALDTKNIDTLKACIDDFNR